MPDYQDDAAVREMTGLAAALLMAARADTSDDLDAVAATLGTLDRLHILGFMLGLTNQLGALAYDTPERFAAALAAWPPGGMLPMPGEVDV